MQLGSGLKQIGMITEISGIRRPKFATWMQWEPDRIWIGVDDFVMGDWSPDSVPAGYWDHMRQPFYFVANFATAPSWLPGPEPGDFPARMLIDWIWYKPLPASAESN